MRELAAAYAAGEAYGAEAAIEMLSKSRLQVLNSDPEVEYFMPSPSGPVQVQPTVHKGVVNEYLFTIKLYQ